MTECTTERIEFTPLRRRQIVADFLGGRLTTDGGALLLREVDRRIGLIDAINDCIPDPRDPRLVIHDQRAMLAQRIVSIALGYEYKSYCFLPLYVFCGDQLLCAYLRPSKIDGAKHARAITKLLVDAIGDRWPNVKITIRGDSGFCRWRLMRWCDNHGVSYIFGLARNKVLERHIAELLQQAESAFDATGGEKQRMFAETHYAANSWDRQRRVIMKAERLAAGPNTRFVVTNLDGTPQSLYDDNYVQRGEMENRIKEQQLMLFADRTSCHDFLANQFRLLLSSFAYLLVETLRRDHLANTELAKAQVSTIRLKIFKVAARVVTSVRRVVFHLSTSYPGRDIFRQLVKSLIISPG